VPAFFLAQHSAGPFPVHFFEVRSTDPVGASSGGLKERGYRRAPLMDVGGHVKINVFNVFPSFPLYQ
jgi:hypothetical protein